MKRAVMTATVNLGIYIVNRTACHMQLCQAVTSAVCHFWQCSDHTKYASFMNTPVSSEHLVTHVHACEHPFCEPRM